MSTELQRLVRYCHPAKLLGTTRLPGIDALDERALAQLYGTSVDEWRACVSALREEARASARVLAAEGLVRALRPRPEDPIVSVGDSHTDDLASWAEILRHLLHADGIDVLNAGISGDTTTSVLARLDKLPRSTLTVVLVGTNDARSHGRAGAPMLVSHSETARNLDAIQAALGPRSRDVVWITPPPVDEQRIAADPWLVESDLTWRLADVAEKARLVRNLDPRAVDLWPAFGPEHLAADGLHPSPAGQRLIVERLVDVLLKRFSSHPTANAVSGAAGRRQAPAQPTRPA